MPHYKLISFELCPFVQRSVITLNEKGVPFEIQHIDLRNKPDWFLALSPTGKVPLLVVDGETILFESAVISEYLDEVTGGGMLPADPLAKAHARAWIEVASLLVGEAWRLQTAKEEKDAMAAKSKIGGYLEKLDQSVRGPLFAGSAFGLVDAATAPALQRLTWLCALDPSLGLFEGLPKVSAWRDALLARPSVQRSTVPDIEQRYLDSTRKAEAWVARS